MRFNLDTPKMILQAREHEPFYCSHSYSENSKLLHLLLQMLVFMIIFLVITGSESIVNNLLDKAITFDNVNGISALLATTLGILIVLLFVALVEKRPFITVGLTRRGVFREYVRGLRIGVLMCALAMGLVWLSGAATPVDMFHPTLMVFVVFFVGFMIQAMSEELFCRGYFLTALAQKQTLPIAVAASSVGFALVHLSNSAITPLAIINIILFGAFTGIYMLKRGSIWGVAAIHTAWNFTQGCIFGISVSGHANMPTAFRFAPVDGKDWISGGSFGLEGGLAVTLVLLLALLGSLLMKVKEN